MVECPRAVGWASSLRRALLKMVAVLPPICSGVGRTAVAAGALAPFAADADRAVNSFVSVEAEGVRAAGDGSLHFANATSPVPVTVTARPGWKVNGRRSLSFVHRPGATDVLRVASELGEDHTHVTGEDCTFASHSETNHVSKPIVQVIPAADRLLAMYALPATNVLISASATWKTVSNGVHRIVQWWEPCSCDAVHDPAAVTNDFAVAPILQKWTSSAEGVVTNAPTWTGWMTKGLDQPISFKVWCTNECGQCRCNASTNTLVDVHELSIGNDLYLGLDRTDAGRTNYTMRTATALIDPEPKEKEFTSYQWTDCGNICTFAGPTDEQIVTYQAYNDGPASERCLDQDLTVMATVREKSDLSVSATCTTNFTVVKVDIYDADHCISCTSSSDLVVGEPVHLFAVVTPNIPVKRYLWSIPETVAKAWEANNQQSLVVDMSEADIESDRQNFYWIEKTDKRSVEVAGFLNETKVGCWTDFSPQRPSCGIEVELGKIEIDKGELSCGNPVGVPGIRITATNGDDIRGMFDWVQICKNIRREHIRGNGTSFTYIHYHPIDMTT